MRKFALLSALMLLAPVASQAATLEDLLVEKGVISRGEAQAASSANSKVYWNKGTKIDFPDNGFTVGIATFMQTRYQFTDNDEDSGKVNTSSFSVDKARLIVSGSALNNEFSYKIEGDFVGTSDSTGTKSPDLRDAYLAWNACDNLEVKMGQFKTFLGRQNVNSDSAIQFADRSLVSNYFSMDRQNGAAANFKLAEGTVLLSAGVFNGQSDGERGRNKPGVDTKHTGMISARWNPVGKMNAYEEGDVDWTDDMALSFGGVYAFADANQDLTDAGAEDTSDNRISVDANMKYQGWSAHAELFNQSFEGDQAGNDDQVEPTGFYAQLGYFVDPKTVELAARYGYLDCDDGKAKGICAGMDNVNEVAAGVNYYWWKHHLKAQVNYVLQNQDAMGAGGQDLNTNKWIMQLSSTF